MTPRPVPELAHPALITTPPWPTAAITLTPTSPDQDHPDRWIVRAEVPLPQCPPTLRHVGHIELALVDLRLDAQRAADAAEWAPAFLGHAVGHTDGTLLDELEDLIPPGPDRLLIVRRMYIEDAWRGCGLAGPLLTAALHRTPPGRAARLAASRIEPRDICAQIPGLVPAEARYAALRTRRLLARAGFWHWHGAYLTALPDPNHPQPLAHQTSGRPPAWRGTPQARGGCPGAGGARAGEPVSGRNPVTAVCCVGYRGRRRFPSGHHPPQ